MNRTMALAALAILVLGSQSTVADSAPPAPTVRSVAPNLGPTSGFQTVTLTGTFLTGATAVTFGSTPANSFSVVDDDHVTAVTPAHVAGIANVTVTTPDGTSAAAGPNRYTWVNPPKITSLSASAGPIGGGNTILINGTGYTGVSAVHFGPTEATSYTVVSSQRISVVVPATNGTAVFVHVTAAGGTNRNSGPAAYTYRRQPVITGLSPDTGTAAGGTVVTITGTDLADVSRVLFGSSTATFTQTDSTTITATSPPHSAGLVIVRVTTPGGTSAAPNAAKYTYQ